MSQIIKDLTSGSLPPTVATSFVTDSGTAIPLANVLNINALDSTVNNDNGILTRANPNLSNNLEIVITNRIQGATTTVGAATNSVIIFPLGATPGTYTIEVRIAGAEATTPGGVGYSLFGSVYTTGAAATIQGTVDRINNENPALVGATATMIASGNSALVTVTGVALLSINWVAVGLYTFAGT